MPRLTWWRKRDHERTWGETASAWLDGELAPVDATRFREHKDACQICTARIDDYRRQGNRLTAAGGVVATPAPYRVFEHVSNAGSHPLPLRVPGRLALAASAVMVIGGGAATPQVRTELANAAQYVQAVISPSSAASLVGDRAVFNAPHDSVVVGVAHQYGIFAADSSGQAAKPMLDVPVARGPVFALMTGNVLYQPAAGPDAGWRVAGADGGVALFPIPPGMQVLDVTPAGDRILLRTPDGHGGYSSAAGATQVVDDTGSVIWIDSGGADVYSLSPDGKYALSGDPNALLSIPLSGGDLHPTPYTGRLVSRPQTSADGTVQAFVSEPNGRGGPAALRYAILRGGFGVPSFTQIPQSVEPVFALSPDGRYLAAQVVESGTAGTLNIWALGPTSATPTSIAAFNGTTIERLTWSPDGRRLLVLADRGGKGEAWLVDPPAGLAQVLSGTDVAAAAWRPDGSGVVAISDDGDAAGRIAVGTGAKAGQVTRLDAGEGAGQPPLYSNNGGLVALLQPVGDAKLVARKGLAPLGVPAPVDGWSWSSDGRRAVVVRGSEVYLWSARSGLDSQPLTAGTSAEWSPAGDRIFVLGQAGHGVVIDGRGQRVADAPDELAGVSLHWAPDGRSLAGVLRAAGGDRLVTWSPGTAAVADVARGGNLGSFAWSPNGQELAYFEASADGAGATLYVVPATGGGPRSVGKGSSKSGALLWQTDGSRVFYIDQVAPGSPGRLRSAAADGSDDRVVSAVWAVNLAAAPK